MASYLTTASSPSSSSSLFHFKSFSLAPLKSSPFSSLRFGLSFSLISNSIPPRLMISSYSAPNPNGQTQSQIRSHSHPIVRSLKSCAKGAILIAATTSMVVHFPHSQPRLALAEQTQILDEEQQKSQNQEEQEKPQYQEEQEKPQNQEEQSSPLSELLKSNSEAAESLKTLLQQKLENGEDEESLKILKRLVSAQPSVTEWKFLMARLLGEMGDTEGARNVFEEILAVNPLSFEALFENALLMDRCGEGEMVIKRLEEALSIAEAENKAKEARDVKLIVAQIQFLQKKVEEALNSYQELVKEDPNDFRPYFCQGMIYSLLDRNSEAKEQFAKYKQLSPKKLDVDGYLRTPLSRMKLFGSDG